MIIFVYNESVILSLIWEFIFTYKGGPGSGKGTQCRKLAQKYGFMHLSVEDLIQNEAVSGRSKTIRDITDSGEFISGVRCDSKINVISSMGVGVWEERRKKLEWII